MAFLSRRCRLSTVVEDRHQQTPISFAFVTDSKIAEADPAQAVRSLSWDRPAELHFGRGLSQADALQPQKG